VPFFNDNAIGVTVGAPELTISKIELAFVPVVLFATHTLPEVGTAGDKYRGCADCSRQNGAQMGLRVNLRVGHDFCVIGRH
jgi:hypothetical protein